MTAVYRKELRGFFTSPVGYVVIALFLAVIGVCTRLLNLKSGGYPMFEYSLTGSAAGMMYVFLIPILAMRSLSEERKQKTDQLLYALPLRPADVVVGKYLAMLTVLAIPTALICLYPLILSLYGEVEFAGAYAGIALFFLLGAALLAICTFLSSLTESQLVAAVVGAVTLFGLFALPTLASLLPSTTIASVLGFLVLIALAALLVYRLLADVNLTLILSLILCLILTAFYLLLPEAFEGSFASLLRAVSLFSLADTAILGRFFDLTAVVLYLSVTVSFLFFSVLVMEKRRWN